MLLALVIVCFTLSGFAALLYQTAWLRLFAITFGTSEIAVAVVLAGYMGGLAIGAAIAAKYVDELRRPVLTYGVLEGAVALAALSLPLLVDVTGEIYGWLAGNQPGPPNAGSFQQSLYYSIASFLVLLIPTALMGATLPLLARYIVTSNRNIGSRVSMLYSVNTIGAVGGTLAAGFVLLPALGLRGTIWVGVTVNGLIFVIAIFLARYVAHHDRSSRIALHTDGSGPDVRPRFILPLILLSGALSFIYEVLWTRMLSHVLGSSIYAFSTMLAAFLTGIAIGAAGAGMIARNPRRAMLMFGVSQIAIALTSAFVYSRLEQWQPSGMSLALFAFVVILPSSIFIGATYPLAVRAHARSVSGVGHSTALVYSWNTVGAIAGALLGGFIVIPMLGFAGTAKFAVIGNLILGVISFLVIYRNRYTTVAARLNIAAAVAIVVVTVLQFQPDRPDSLVNRALFGGSGARAVREVYYAVGRSTTVMMTENASRFDLSTNGLPEAQIEFKGAPPIRLSQRWLGLWPSLARPGTESVMVVGLGGGVVVEGIPASVRSIDVVELEAEVVKANALIGDRRSVDPLGDSRVTITINDARNALRLSLKTYDAIVSQPSHPWTAGASHLYTKEFFSLIKSRLNIGGVFVQWMNAEFLDETLLRRLVATLLAEFEYVQVYQPTALALHFVASDTPIDIDAQLEATGKAILDEPSHFAQNGISGPADVIAALFVDDAGARSLAQGHGPITDDDNRMATDSNVLAAGLDSHDLTEMTAGVDPLLVKTSWLRKTLRNEELVSIAWRLVNDGQTDRVRHLIESVDSLATRNVLQAILYRNEGRLAEAQTLLKAVGPDESVYETAVFLRIVERIPRVLAGTFQLEDLPGLDLQNSRLGAVLLGWHALGARDWQTLQKLDRRLSEMGMFDLWAPYAAQLQAEWRLHDTDAMRERVTEAAALIERGLATKPTVNLYALRACVALQTGDTSAFVESTAFLVQAIKDRLWDLNSYGVLLEPAERRSMISRLEDAEKSLRDAILVDSTGRAATVMAQALELKRSL